MNDSNTVLWALSNPESPEAKTALAKSIGDLQEKVDGLEEREAVRGGQLKVILSIAGLILGVVQPLLIWYITK